MGYQVLLTFASFGWSEPATGNALTPSDQPGDAVTLLKKDVIYNKSTSTIELAPRDDDPKNEHHGLQGRSPEVYYNEVTHSIDLNSSVTPFLTKRHTNLRLFYDTHGRVRVLFSGFFASQGLSDAFLSSSVNVAQNLAGALQAYLRTHGLPNVEVWAHYANHDWRNTGTIGISVRNLGVGYLMIRNGVEGFFVQNGNVLVSSILVANAFDLSAFRYFNPVGGGPTSRKRSAEQLDILKRQAVTTDYCTAPIGNIWNIVAGDAIGSFVYTLQC
ncbi:MAG: hypothetical protein Q9218_002996 [Villophora microphyllina]